MTIPPPNTDLYREAGTAAWLGLIINGILGVVKLTAALLSGSLALLSDAVNSLGDVLTSSAVVFALRFAQRPPDKEHPYGHSKAEAIAGLSVSLLVLISALLVGWESVRELGEPRPLPPPWTLLVAAVNVVIKESLYWYTKDVSRRSRSLAMHATAWDHRSDALCSLAVCIGLSLVYFGGPNWAKADGLAALAVVILIVRSGTGLFFNSCRELMDLQAEDELVDEVRAASASVPGVEAIEKLRIRKSGLEFFVDIHVEVDPEMTVERGHRISHDVKDLLITQFASVRDVLVHIEPHRKTNLKSIS